MKNKQLTPEQIIELSRIGTGKAIQELLVAALVIFFIIISILFAVSFIQDNIRDYKGCRYEKSLIERDPLHCIYLEGSCNLFGKKDFMTTCTIPTSLFTVSDKSSISNITPTGSYYRTKVERVSE